MTSLKKLEIKASVDKISFTQSNSIGEIKPLKIFGDYILHKSHPTRIFKEDGIHKPFENYKTIWSYINHKTGNYAFLCFTRKNNRKRKSIPSFIISFYSSFLNPLKYDDVEIVICELINLYGGSLRVSDVNIAIDFINPKTINLYQRICCRAKPGKKAFFLQYDTTSIYGAPISACVLEIYDKIEELESVKKLYSTEDICRIECRLKIPNLNNFVSSLEDVGNENWSWLYHKYFSFHYPNQKLIKKVKNAHQKTIWELRDLVAMKLNIPSAIFYRDYLREHNLLTPMVKRLLTNYRWIQNQKIKEKM